jgi:hypothetical protein
VGSLALSSAARDWRALAGVTGDGARLWKRFQGYGFGALVAVVQLRLRHRRHRSAAHALGAVRLADFSLAERISGGDGGSRADGALRESGGPGWRSTCGAGSLEADDGLGDEKAKRRPHIAVNILTPLQSRLIYSLKNLKNLP